MKWKDFLRPTWKKVIIFLILIILFSVTSMLIFGTYPYSMVLVSSSMRPTYSRGDILFINHVDFHKLKIGDVIVYKGPNELLPPLVARIVSIDYKKEIFTTKGDANKYILELEKDLGAEKIIGKVLFSIPILGYLDLYHLGPFLRLLFIYFLALIINYFVFDKKTSD